jgi:hypothetical protein
MRTSVLSGVVVAIATIVLSSATEALQRGSVEQTVMVHFDYGNTDWAPFFAFEKTLSAAIDSSGEGDYDGNELAVDGSDGTLYIYGLSADKVFAVAQPLLKSCALLKHVTVTLVYGKLGDNNVPRKSFALGS